MAPSLLTHQFQAEPYRGSCRVVAIIGRLDLGYASNPDASSYLFKSAGHTLRQHFIAEFAPLSWGEQPKDTHIPDRHEREG